MMWFLKWFIEQLVQNSLSWLVEQVGPFGNIALALIVGLSLLVGGPIYMSRDNKQRQLAERRPRYGWLEYVIVVSSGFVFTTVGLVMLVNQINDRWQ
jgi:hypothetical protein